MRQDRSGTIRREAAAEAGRYGRGMIHALTIDVEDYHNIFARDRLKQEGPPTEAVVRNTHRLLSLFERHAARGTFFTLGEVARDYPELIREIAAAGHELGVHGFYHRQLFKLTPDAFRREVSDAKQIIEDIIGVPVHGHRAPAFSIMPPTSWGLEVLADAGFTYDSSVFPINGRRYGWPGFRPDIHVMELSAGRRIVEAPLSTVSILGRRLPACGGGYLRHFPGSVTSWAMRKVGEARPAILYMHPYEIEMDDAPLDTTGLTASEARKVRRFHKLQLRNRQTVEPKLVSLLTRFQFEPLQDIIERSLGAGLSETVRAHANVKKSAV